MAGPFGGAPRWSLAVRFPHASGRRRRGPSSSVHSGGGRQSPLALSAGSPLTSSPLAPRGPVAEHWRTPVVPAHDDATAGSTHARPVRRPRVSPVRNGREPYRGADLSTLRASVRRGTAALRPARCVPDLLPHQRR